MPLPYVVSEVPYDKGHTTDGSKLYYCHARNYPDIPVFGSIGDKAKAKEVCKLMNQNVRR